MVPPKEGRTTRVIDETYLQYLEAKIRANPNAVVAPLVANITLPPGNQLEEGNLEYYDFEMIGGNHSRLVFQRLLNSPLFKSNPAVTHRSAVVYANLSVEEVLVVGQEHNAAAEDHLASKFQDEVHLARNMLKRCTSSMKFSEHADGGDQFQQLLKRVFLIEHLDKAEQRKAMGTLGTLKMLSQMSVRCWEKVEGIFNLYEQMEVKGQKPSKNPQLGLPDCKKAKWQFLHNLPEQQQYELLTGLAQKELSFKEAEMKARHMKKEAKVKEALEQLFKQPYDAILKNRPQLGDAQMTEALARALPEHKRKLEITDEFSALCSVAKGTISEGGEKNLHGHKLTAQTYSASVGVKPEVVIWEASESDTSVQCEGLMSYARTRITGTSCNDSPVTVVVLCSPQQIGQLMRPMGDNTYLLFYNKPDSSQGKEVPFRQTTAAAIVTSTGPSPADPYLSNTSENFVRWDEIPPVTFFATIYSLSSECVLLYNCNSDTCKELLRYRNTVAVMEDPQRLLHQVAPKKKTGTGSKEKDVTSEKQGSTPRKRKQDTQSEGTPMHKKKCTNQEVQKWVDDKIHSILGGKAENVQSKRDQVERFRKGEMVAILPEKSEYTGTPWIGKCTSYDPKRDELDVKWYRGSYKGPWYPDNRYHQTKLPFSAVLVWGFKLTPEKTLPDSTVEMLKDVLKEHDLH